MLYRPRQSFKVRKSLSILNDRVGYLCRYFLVCERLQLSRLSEGKIYSMKSCLNFFSSICLFFSSEESLSSTALIKHSRWFLQMKNTQIFIVVIDSNRGCFQGGGGNFTIWRGWPWKNFTWPSIVFKMSGFLSWHFEWVVSTSLPQHLSFKWVKWDTVNFG